MSGRSDTPTVARNDEEIVAEQAEIHRAVAGRTLCAAFADTVGRWGTGVALRWAAAGGWNALTWQEYGDRVRLFSLGLRQLGFGPGDSALLLMRNRPEHVIADAAIVHARGVPVSAYITASPEQLCHVANHSEATIAIVEPDLFDALGDVRSRFRTIRQIVKIGHGDLGGDSVSWDAVVAGGRECDDEAAFERCWSAAGPDDPAMIVYTSGTTGAPKGAVHTHRTVLSALESLARRGGADQRDRLISYLPLAHSAERWWSHWRGIVGGATTTFCSDPAQLVDTLVDVRPTWFLGVPRTWEKLAAGVRAAIENEPDADRRAALAEALDVGRSLVQAEQRGLAVPSALKARRDELKPLLTALLATFGLDQCRAPVSGAAPLSDDVATFFHALGLRVSEGWGMTELFVGIWNGLDRIKIGTVGPPLPGVEARIAADGELLVRAGGIMVGYHADPAATEQVVGPEGWLRTGDIAQVDDDGYVRIVDRKKDIIITSGGTKVTPATIEQLLRRNPLVGQVCVVGERRPYLCALIVLNREVAGSWASTRGLGDATMKELVSHPEMRAEVQGAVEAANASLARPERIKQFVLVDGEWSVERGELTPTLKVRRDVVGANHAEAIEQMYR